MQKTLAFILMALLAAFSTFYIFRDTNSVEVNSVIEERLTYVPQEVPSYTSELDIDYLRQLKIDSDVLVIVEELSPGSNYQRYIASYESDGNTIFGLLTVPTGDIPEGGHSAIVFNHGYIPPANYSTTQNYVAYVDYLARNGFVVFKIDMRGHGNSEGTPTGSYFSPGYTIDAISALKSLQKLDYVNPEKIGMWGHSMAGNLVMRAMLVEDEIAASVIWAGAVYSYEDFATYRLYDNSYVRRQRTPQEEQDDERDNSKLAQEVDNLRNNENQIDFTDEFWSSISLTQNLNYLKAPVQLHHSVDDPVVNIGYSRDLATTLEENNKEFELYEYEGGGHNINSPYFDEAMVRTVEFFRKYL